MREDTHEWLLNDASPLHREVLIRLAQEPAPTIKIARDLDRHAWDVSCCLQDLKKKYLVGERTADDPRYKREYVLTDYGERQQKRVPVPTHSVETASRDLPSDASLDDSGSIFS